MTKAVPGIIGGSGIYDLSVSRNLHRYADIGAARRRVRTGFH